jgi:8-oxo-dGTP diphosphatase/A/G-specific adenine glycosylase
MYPAMPAEQALKLVEVGLGIVVGSEGQILICRRRSNDSFGGYWEFPGGKIEAGESPAECVRRELREELDIAVTPVRALDVIEHEYPKARVRLHPFVCNHDAGEPMAISAAEFVWVSPPTLRQYRFPEGNRRLVQSLAEGLVSLPGALDLTPDNP